LLGAKVARTLLEALLGDQNKVALYRHDRIVIHSVGDMAREALVAINKTTERGISR